MNKWIIWWRVQRRQKISRMIVKIMRKRRRRWKSILQKSNKVTKTRKSKKIKMTMKVKSLLNK